MQLERPSSPAEAVAALGDGGARPRRRHRGRAAAARGARRRASGSSTSPARCPRGVDGRTIGAGTTLAELEADPQIPAALREACRLAASPQLRNMGTIGGNLLQATRCWYWRLEFPCYLHGGDRCHAKAGQHREHAFFGNERCASAHPSDPAAALLALGARDPHRPPRARARRAVPAADRRRPRDDDARARRADPRARRARGRVERLPEGDGPEAVGVRARRRRCGARRRRDADRALGRRARSPGCSTRRRPWTPRRRSRERRTRSRSPAR